MESHKELEVWKRLIELVDEIYIITRVTTHTPQYLFILFVISVRLRQLADGGDPESRFGLNPRFPPSRE